MVGMGAMVGGGTGAVMTAVTMIFEMTLDYSIVMPMIVAVAMSIGTRRMLSRETIYTLKLVRRGRAIPKARHANMFLVRSAREVMDADIQVLPVEASFDEYLRQPEHAGRLRHVVVTDNGHIYGVIRVNTGIRRGLGGRAHRGDPGRCRQPKLHRGAARTRPPSRSSAACGAGTPSWQWWCAGTGSTRQRRCRRDHQGARRRLGRRQRQSLSGVVVAVSWVLGNGQVHPTRRVYRRPMRGSSVLGDLPRSKSYSRAPRSDLPTIDFSLTSVPF